jgi:nicotinate-nucleotide pyrophosphorylase (carboxylating)
VHPGAIPQGEISAQVARALAEDIGDGDVTAMLVPENVMATAHVTSRQAAVLCGTDWFDEVFRQVDAGIRIDWQLRDSDQVPANTLLCHLHGPARALLTAERTALNFLQTLSATATLAAQYAEAVKGTGAKVLDTRKTIPGLRIAQKYAVRCGGCFNHRIGLFDAILIKENHIASCGSIAAAVGTARATAPDLLLEVEVENLDQLRECLAAGVDRILLDNMSVDMLREAVSMNRGQAELEASGGIHLENIRTIAETGVDYISVGSLTKDIAAIDLSMRIDYRTGTDKN